jgi:outer membrane protein OmpA-like peptidoglycan-associated protein
MVATNPGTLAPTPTTGTSTTGHPTPPTNPKDADRIQADKKKVSATLEQLKKDGVAYRVTEKGIEIQVPFDVNKDKPSNGGLDKALANISKNIGGIIQNARVEATASQTGTTEHNKKLSEQRANEVVKAAKERLSSLKDKSVEAMGHGEDPNKMIVPWKGPGEPTEKDEKLLAANRQAVLFLALDPEVIDAKSVGTKSDNFQLSAAEKAKETAKQRKDALEAAAERGSNAGKWEEAQKTAGKGILASPNAMVALKSKLGEQLKVSEKEGVVTEAKIAFTKDVKLKDVEVVLNSDGVLTIGKNGGQQPDAIIKQVAAKLNSLLPPEVEDQPVVPPQNPDEKGKTYKPDGEWGMDDRKALESLPLGPGSKLGPFMAKKLPGLVELKHDGDWVVNVRPESIQVRRRHATQFTKPNQNEIKILEAAIEEALNPA